MANRKRAKMNIPLIIACVLLCLTLFSIHLTSGIFAKYTTRADGKDSAKIAKWGELSITETGDFDSGSAMMIPGVDLEKEATVNFGKAEVATYIFIEVDVSENWAVTEDEGEYTYSMLDGDISWAIAEGWTAVSETENKVYYKYLEPNKPLENADIIKDGTITVSENITRKEMPASETEIFINFRATAVQAGGFETAEDAWANVSAKG